MADPDLATVVGPWAAGAVAETIEGRTAVFLPAAEQILYLNETATTILALCDGTRTEDEIVHATARAYARPAGEVSPEVRRLLRELRAGGMFAVGERHREPEPR